MYLKTDKETRSGPHFSNGIQRRFIGVLNCCQNVVEPSQQDQLAGLVFFLTGPGKIADRIRWALKMVKLVHFHVWKDGWVGDQPHPIFSAPISNSNSFVKLLDKL